MDLNMPVMDGKEASKLILEMNKNDLKRKMNNLHDNKLPYANCSALEQLPSKINTEY